MIPLNRIFHGFPNRIQTITRRVIAQSDILLLFRLYFGKGSFLKRSGWLESERVGAPVDEMGDPIPWYCYPAIKFLEERIDQNLRVFEYGSGHSSCWYGERVKEVVAVEHELYWAELVNQMSPMNVSVIHEGEMSSYISSCTNRGFFDIIVIDGRRRSECVKSALNALSNEGVIIWDDSDWLAKEKDFHPLKKAGFRRLQFFGLKPLSANGQETSIFYRNCNCLGI